MFQTIKLYLCRILVLLIFFSPMQVINAADFNHDEHSQNCSMDGSQNHHQSAPSTSEVCAMQHDEHCSDHPECVAHHSQSPIHTSSAGLFVSRAISQLRFTPSHDSILTVYNSPLKRPPKS